MPGGGFCRREPELLTALPTLPLPVVTALV
jgi:hypothetical protein